MKQEKILEINEYLRKQNIYSDSLASDLKVYMVLDQKIEEIKYKLQKLTPLNINNAVCVPKAKLFKLLEEYHICSFSANKTNVLIKKYIGSNSSWGKFVKSDIFKRSAFGEWFYPIDAVEQLILEINANRFS
mgnify:CR=1 FL=1|tara:strand:+ start:6680 stop:7075 length:396 start_codon:yes stop_codon:yes gene_type:complete